MKECMESELPGYFLCKTGDQKYVTWVPKEPRLRFLCSMMSISEETHKCCEPDR